MSVRSNRRSRKRVRLAEREQNFSVNLVEGTEGESQAFGTSPNHPSTAIVSISVMDSAPSTASTPSMASTPPTESESSIPSISEPIEADDQQSYTTAFKQILRECCRPHDDAAASLTSSKKRQWLWQLGNAVGEFDIYNKECLTFYWSLRVPALMLMGFAAVPKLVALWVFVILLKPIVLRIFHFCPERMRRKLHARIPEWIRSSPSLEDLNEGIDQARPFILFWLYLCCAPFALSWMAVHWIKGFWPTQVNAKEEGEGKDKKLIFPQNRKHNWAESENNFYHSRAFGIVLFAFFAMGIPAFISLAVYQGLGVDRLVLSSPAVGIIPSNPSAPPTIRVPQVGLANALPPPVQPEIKTVTATNKGTAPRDEELAPPATDNGVIVPHFYEGTAVAGYNGYWPWLQRLGVQPTLRTIFFVHFYIISLASALCVLFFRAWFTFPLNFLSDEHEVELTASGIRRRNQKGWFLNVITLNQWASGGGPDSLKWKEVSCVRHPAEGFTRLCPLPETAFKKESLSYKLLNKMAALIDGLSDRMHTTKATFLVFSVAEKTSDFGRNIKMNINDLNREQRAKLYYAVKNWAPHVTIMQNAEEKLIGSSVLKDVRYTQIWFDLLTSKTSVQRRSTLSAGETLRGNEFTIEGRLSSGGQATTYLAHRASGDQCVLKEFILATSPNSGTLIESAQEFEAEVSLLSQLNHQGIVRLEDFFAEDGRVYVVLEHVQGESLRQKVKRAGPLDQNEVMRIGAALCDILDYLHAHNPPIVHRDITPENIMMQPDGSLKLIDFSLALKQDGRQTTDSCAKQAFTPSEQFRDEVCTQSDIYALGATMYYLLTAQNPKPISRSSPNTKAPGVDSQLNHIVEHATEIDLDRRYESVRWLKLDLNTIIAKDTALQLAAAPDERAS